MQEIHYSNRASPCGNPITRMSHAARAVRAGQCDVMDRVGAGSARAAYEHSEHAEASDGALVRRPHDHLAALERVEHARELGVPARRPFDKCLAECAPIRQMPSRMRAHSTNAKPNARPFDKIPSRMRAHSTNI